MKIIGGIEEAVSAGFFDNIGVVILGAGKDGKEAAKKLLAADVRIDCFIDNEKEKWGKVYHGIPVREPETVGDLRDKVGLIAIGSFTWLSEIEIMTSRLVEGCGFPSERLLLLDRSRLIAERVRQDFEERNIAIDGEVLEIGELRLPNYLRMGSDIVKTFLVEAADLLLPRYFNDWSVVDEGPYEDEEIMSPGGGHSSLVIDCGANLGLFSAIAASKGAEVYAFEPIPRSRGILRKVAELYEPHIRIFPFALSNFSGVAKMSNGGNLGQNKIVAEGESTCEITVECMTVDDFVCEESLSYVDFIKADIEGAERDMSRGAEGVLREFGPKLSLCTYHLDDDPKVLEAIIRGINPDYRVVQQEKKLFAFTEQ